MFLILLISILISQDANFSSQSYKRLSDGKLFLKGNVDIKIDGSKITADQVTFDVDTQDFTAEGNAEFTKPNGDIVKGNILSGNIGKKDFSGKNVITSGKEGYFTGEKVSVKRIGENGEQKDIQIKRGSYTSCCNNPPDWEIWGSSIDAETEGYAHIYNAVFKIKKVPFFYLPYFIVPTKKERQSGLLFPEIHFGSDGKGFSLPLFVTLGRSHDFTITPGIIHHRGYNSALEFRSVFSEYSWQVFNGFYTEDNLYGENRYYLSLKNFFKTSDKSHLMTNLGFVSDIFLARDFPFVIDNNYDPALENSLSFVYNNQDFLFNTQTVIYQNIIEEGYVRRLPYLYTNYNKTLGPVITDFNFSVDSLMYNGKNDRDIFVDLKTNISVPQSFWGLNFKPLLTLDFANLAYKHPEEEKNKTYLAYDFSLNINSIIFRNYGDTYHSIEPFVEYHIKNDESSYFNFYDFYDELFKVSSTNYIMYGLKSRLNSKGSLFFEIKDTYDFVELKREQLLTQLYGSIWLFQFNSQAVFYDLNDFSNSVLNLGLKFGLYNNFLGTSFLYSKSNQKQEIFDGMLSFWGISFYSRIVYDYLEQVVKEKLYSVAISPNSKCWSFKFEAKDTFEKPGVDYRYLFSIVVAGESIGFTDSSLPK